jgi:hypothetical protein
MAKRRPHPMQQIGFDDAGCARFRPNEIVRFLLSVGQAHRAGLNELAASGRFSKDDWSQFMQQIGYSVSGWGDLGFATRREVRKADARAEQIGKGERPKTCRTALVALLAVIDSYSDEDRINFMGPCLKWQEAVAEAREVVKP